MAHKRVDPGLHTGQGDRNEDAIAEVQIKCDHLKDNADETTVILRDLTRLVRENEEIHATLHSLHKSALTTVEDQMKMLSNIMIVSWIVLLVFIMTSNYIMMNRMSEIENTIKPVIEKVIYGKE